MLPTLLSVALLCQTVPTDLVVLVHGLYGGDNNLRVLRDTLQILGHGSVVVVSSSSNIGKTREGVVARFARVLLLLIAAARPTPSRCRGATSGGTSLPQSLRFFIFRVSLKFS